MLKYPWFESSRSITVMLTEGSRMGKTAALISFGLALK